MNRRIIGLLVLATLAGCSKNEGALSAPHGVAAGAPMGSRLPAVQRTLAYHHTLDVNVAEDKVAPTFEAGQAACRALQAEQCTVLNAQLTGPSSNAGHARETASASLSMRALPAAIPKLMATFAARGEVTRKSSSAEELSGPLEDQAKKIALLTDYRDKLEGLRVRASTDIDSLIKVNSELATVQGQLEAAAGAQAALQRRVDTELLDVTIGAELHQSFWRPIGQSVNQFGTTLSQGTATAISGAAYLIPWLLMLGFFAWIVRKLWRRRR